MNPTDLILFASSPALLRVGLLEVNSGSFFVGIVHVLLGFYAFVIVFDHLYPKSLPPGGNPDPEKDKSILLGMIPIGLIAGALELFQVIA